MPRRKQICPKRMKHGEDGEETTVNEETPKSGEEEEEEEEGVEKQLSGEEGEQGDPVANTDSGEVGGSSQNDNNSFGACSAYDDATQHDDTLTSSSEITKGFSMELVTPPPIDDIPKFGITAMAKLCDRISPPPSKPFVSKNGLDFLECEPTPKETDKCKSQLEALYKLSVATEHPVPLTPVKHSTPTKASDLLKLFQLGTFSDHKKKDVVSMEEDNLLEAKKNSSDEVCNNHDEPLDLSMKQEDHDMNTQTDGALDLTKRTSGTKRSAADDSISFLRQLEEKFGTNADELSGVTPKKHKPHALPSFSTNVFTAALYNMKPMATTDLVYRKEMKQVTASTEMREKSPRTPHETQTSPSTFIDKSMKILHRRTSEMDKINPAKLTAFVCECKREFDTLYNLTIHIQETNHMPKKHRTITGDYPKLVRGQDMWLTQGSEQTRQILRCMQCGQSFKSLPELTVHMMQTRHYAKIMSSDSQRTPRPLSPTSSEEMLRDPQSPSSIGDDTFQNEKSHSMFPDVRYKQPVKSPPCEDPGNRGSHSWKETKSLETVGVRCEKCGKEVPYDNFTKHVHQCVKAELESSAYLEERVKLSPVQESKSLVKEAGESEVKENESSELQKPPLPVNDYLTVDDKESSSSSSFSALAAMEKFVTTRFDSKNEKDKTRPTLSDAISSFPLTPTFQYPRSKLPEHSRSEKLNNYLNMFCSRMEARPDSTSREESGLSNQTSHSETLGPLNLCLPKYVNSMTSGANPASEIESTVSVSSVTMQGKRSDLSDKGKNTKDASHEKSDGHSSPCELPDSAVSVKQSDEPLETKYLSVKDEAIVEEKKVNGSALESLKGMVYGHSFTTEHPLDSLQKLIHDSVHQRGPVPDSPLVRNNSMSPYSQAGPSTFILVNPIVTVVSPPGMSVSRNKTPSSDGDESPRSSKINMPKHDSKKEFNQEEKENNNILCKNCGKTYSSMSYRYHTTWCNIASTQIQQKLELKEALHFSPYIYMPLDHNTSCNSSHKPSKSPSQSPKSSETTMKKSVKIKEDPDSTTTADKFHKYYQMADELAKKK